MRKIKKDKREQGTLRKLLRYFTSKRRLLLLTIACATMWAFIRAISPYITGLAFDVIYNSLGKHESANITVLVYIIILFIIAILAFLAQGFALFFVGNLHQGIYKELRGDVGETGSGKTTIISLISRLYDIQTGYILIDGQDIRNVTLPSLRKSVGVVLQEPFLFSESVRYNLCYGKEASDEEIKNVLKLISAEFVYDLSDGLDTKVGERGGWLSLGQRQLISFARALITNPKIILLDEATSSIDPQAELRIQRALSKMLENRTSIIIAHRLSTVRAADRIIVLDAGKIIEEGTFEELLAQKGEFYKLYKLQFRHE